MQRQSSVTSQNGSTAPHNVPTAGQSITTTSLNGLTEGLERLQSDMVPPHHVATVSVTMQPAYVQDAEQMLRDACERANMLAQAALVAAAKAADCAAAAAATRGSGKGKEPQLSDVYHAEAQPQGPLAP